MVLPRREDYTNEASEALERAHACASRNAGHQAAPCEWLHG